MPYPPQFRHLLEPTAGDIEAPDYVWLAYAVCAVTPEACGWGGWMIEAGYRSDGARHPTATGDRLLSAVDVQVCPRCGRETFRTGVTLRLEPSPSQESPIREGVDNDVAPIEYSE